MKLRLFSLVIYLGLASLSAVRADEANLTKQGKVLAYTCHGCHGIENYKNTYPTYSVPKLGGQQPQYVEEALQEYAVGDRAHSTMHAHAASLSQADRKAIAAFLQGTAPRASGAPNGTPPAATAMCVSCHGVNGVSMSDQYPILAGQHRDYLERALRDYKSGKRKNAIMAGFAAQLKDEDIPVIAAFFAAQSSLLCATDKIREKGKCE